MLENHNYVRDASEGSVLNVSLVLKCRLYRLPASWVIKIGAFM